MTVEFVCLCCGWPVVDIAGTRGPRTMCMACEWLAESPLAPAEVERLRGVLGQAPARGPPAESVS